MESVFTKVLDDNSLLKCKDGRNKVVNDCYALRSSNDDYDYDMVADRPVCVYDYLIRRDLVCRSSNLYYLM